MGYLHEVANAVNWVEKEGNESIILLHCTSCYPALPEEANLAAIHKLGDVFEYPVGYSDHTEGVDVACVAAGLGACMVEKHFTLDKSLPGPDHSGSADPSDLKRMIAWIRTMEKAIGDGRKGPADCERIARLKKRRSIYAARDLPIGTRLSFEDVLLLTPSSPESQLEDLPVFLGCCLNIDLKKGDLITSTVF